MGLRLWSELAGEDHRANPQGGPKSHHLFWSGQTASPTKAACRSPQAFGEEYRYGFPESEDSNTAYEFHFYDPYAFTSQIYRPQGIPTSLISATPTILWPRLKILSSRKISTRGLPPILITTRFRPSPGSRCATTGRPRLFQTGLSCVSSQVGRRAPQGLPGPGIRRKRRPRGCSEPDHGGAGDLYIWSPDVSWSSQYDDAQKAAYIENTAGNFSAVLNEANIPP